MEEGNIDTGKSLKRLFWKPMVAWTNIVAVEMQRGGIIKKYLTGKIVRT